MKTHKILDKNHHLTPFSNWKALNEEGGRRIIHKAEGVYFWDEDGKKFIDGMSGLWCVNVGYSCQPIVEAVSKQIQTLPYYNSFFKTSNQKVAELCEILTEITPDNIQHFFFNSSGSEANDTIYRIVKHYYNLKNQNQKRFFISRKNAYHGSTVWAASLGGMNPMHVQMDESLRNLIHHIDQPYSFDAGKTYNDAEFGKESAQWLEDKILELGAENVAAFIGEPIQGAGGVIIPPDNYWKEIRRICDQYNILLISDEVICGFGRTGNWFGCQTYGIQPDLITMAKGISSGYIPLSAVGVSEEVAEVLCKHAQEFFHGYTYSAHPVACAAAIANLNFIIDQNLVSKVKNDLSAYFAKSIQTFSEHPLIGEVRSKGLLIAFEIVKNKETRERFEIDAGTVCRDICVEEGVVSRACKQSMVLAPPLVISHQEIDELLSKLKISFDRTYQKLQKV